MIVHHPQWQKTRELIADGAIGELAHVEARFSFNNAEDVANIRNKPETGGGALPDIGVYAIGSARWVTRAEPERIRFADLRRENGVDVFARFAFDFPDFTYDGLVSMRLFPRQDVTFHGRKGIITHTCPFNAGVFGEAQVRLERPGMEVTTFRWPGVNHYILQVENFGRTVREGVRYPCPLEFSQGTQAMIDAIYAKAREDGA